MAAGVQHSLVNRNSRLRSVQRAWRIGTSRVRRPLLPLNNTQEFRGVIPIVNCETDSVFYKASVLVKKKQCCSDHFYGFVRM